MKKINLKELKTILNNLNNRSIKTYYFNYNKKLINDFLNDKNIKIIDQFINYNSKNILNYVLIIFKDSAMLLQNNKTYLDKSYVLLKDIRSTFDIVLMKNERSIMDHHQIYQKMKIQGVKMNKTIEQISKEKILEKLKKEYLDPFDSIKEWLYCLINFIDLNIDLNLDKNKKEMLEMIQNIFDEIEELE